MSMLKFCLLKQLASKVEIEMLNRLEMACGLLGKMTE